MAVRARSDSSAEGARRQQRGLLLGSLAALLCMFLLARLHTTAVRREFPPQPAPGVRVDVNHADAATLAALDRIGPELARRIVAWREANGPFRSYPDLQRVEGIGPDTVEALLGRVRFGE